MVIVESPVGPFCIAACLPCRAAIECGTPPGISLPTALRLAAQHAQHLRGTCAARARTRPTDPVDERTIVLVLGDERGWTILTTTGTVDPAPMPAAWAAVELRRLLAVPGGRRGHASQPLGSHSRRAAACPHQVGTGSHLTPGDRGIA